MEECPTCGTVMSLDSRIDINNRPKYRSFSCTECGYFRTKPCAAKEYDTDAQVNKRARFELKCTYVSQLNIKS